MPGRSPGLLRRTYEGLRCRLWYRSLDALMTAGLRRGLRRSHLRAMLSPRSTYFLRVASLVAWIDALLPGTARWGRNLVQRIHALPFRIDRIDLLGVGSGASVFLIESGSTRFVLKIYRRTIGKSLKTLRDLAAEFQKKFDTVSSWYAGPHPIVAPAKFLILRGPLMGRRAVACIQPYVSGEMRDPLMDMDDTALLGLMRDNAKLRAQFLFFARRTLETSHRQGSCVDLLGSQNLALVREGDSWGLKILDYGIFDLKSLKGLSPAAFSRTNSILARIQALAACISIGF